MKLLVDIGNSRVKWGLWHDGHLRDTASVLLAEFNGDSVEAAWRSPATSIDAVWYANVAGPEYDGKMRRLCRDVFSLQPERVLTKEKQCGVTNAYERAESLGVDRWLSLIAAHSEVDSDLCVVNAGTAVTIDLLSRAGRHHGGLILPGLSLMIQALNMHTHGIKVADFSADYGNMAASNTTDAVRWGTLAAVVGAIERTMRAYSASGYEPTCLLSGGDADAVANWLTVPTKKVPNLVLLGLGKVSESEGNG